MSRKIVFLDCETGGLDPQLNALVEVAWATEVEPEPRCIILPHDPTKVLDQAAELNGYYKRGLNDKAKWASPTEIAEFLTDLKDATLCGANPAFDAAFMSAHFGYGPFNPPWHYRMLDIESYAMGKLDLDYVPGLREIKEILTGRGYDVSQPDHTAAADVRTLLAAYSILRYI